MPGTGELLGAGQSRGARANHCHILSRPVNGQNRLDPAFLPTAVDDLAFDGFYGDRVVVDVERARRFAGRGTDAAGEFRKVVGRMQCPERRPPLFAIDEIVPVRDEIVDRTAAVTEGNPAIHAARGLAHKFRARQRTIEFAIVSDARIAFFADAVAPFDGEKSGRIAHGYSAATARAPAFSRFRSASALA